MVREFKIDPITGLPTCYADAGGYCCYDCMSCGWNYESALCDAEAKRQKESNEE